MTTKIYAKSMTDSEKILFDDKMTENLKDIYFILMVMTRMTKQYCLEYANGYNKLTIELNMSDEDIEELMTRIIELSNSRDC